MYARQPPDGADDLEFLLYQQESVLAVGQALRHMSRGAIRNRLDRGRWRQPYRGVVVTHSGPLTKAQRIWAGLLSVPGPALLAGTTAASYCGLRGYDRPVIHVLVGASRRPRGSAGELTRESWPVVVHRSTVLTPADARWHGRPPHTTAARSLVDAAQWALHADTAQAIIAAGFQQRLVSAEELYDVLERLPTTRRRHLIMAAVADAAGGAHSLAEIQLVELCRRYRLPPPDQQVRRKDAHGRRRYLDAHWRQWRLHVEVDGRQHTEVRQWWDDMKRQNELWLAGERVLRFPAWVVRHHPDQVAAHLSAALTANGWHP